ncbi:methyl-accepting chemotaxis protein [Rhodovulum sp. DZ06]|uniref:methyl-accepting chemotaxis protein n=1 Tax=Rhodovulum sp. DZ06 TaxID=3425126 RepID=UPI003D33BE4B
MDAIAARWQAEWTELGKSLATRMDPYFEEGIRTVYHHVLGVPMDGLPDEVVALERAKFHLIMRGELGAPYLEIMAKLVPQIMASGISWQQYMIGYHDFQYEMTRAYYRCRKRFEGDPLPALRVIQLATLGDTLKPVSAFFEKMEAEGRAHRDALTAELAEAIGDVAGRAAAGDLSARVDRRFGDPRLDSIAERLNALFATTQEVIGSVGKAMHALAEGDLSAALRAEHGGDLGRLRDDFNQSAGALRSLVDQVKTAAADIQFRAGEIAAGAADISTRASSQAASLEETSAGMAELNDYTRANAAAADQAAQLADTASARAAQTHEAIEANLASMGRIEDGARRIADIVTLIDGIAFQTNLLALNAAVEAARAGEAGKGFAVVASEVRNLAQRASDSAKDIRELIASSEQEVARGVAQAGDTKSALDALASSIQEVKAAVRSISSATRQQADNLAAIAGSVDEVDRLTQDTARLVESSAAEAAQLRGASDQLEELVRVFRVDGGGAAAPMRRAG